MFRTVGERPSVKDRTTRRRYQTVVIGNVQMPAAMVKDRSATKARSRGALDFKLDIPLLMTIITLLILGLIILYSASYDHSFKYFKGDPYHIFSRQLLWLGVGLVAAGIAMWMDYRWLKVLVVPALVLTIGLLLVVLFRGNVMNNAVRNLEGGSGQPSELAKLVLVMYLAVWLNAKRDQLHDVTFGLFPLGVIVSVLATLILLQPDLSAMLTIFLLGGAMFFMGGGSLKQMGILIAIIGVVGALLIAAMPTGRDRIMGFIPGLLDPSTGTWQVQRGMEAFINGGWFGMGIGKGTVKLISLPTPATDSILAVAGEELGTLGVLVIIALYIILLWRGLSIARRATDPLGSLLAAGLTTWITLEAFINMAVVLNLLPSAGNALPLISSGGSNMIFTLAALGLILNVSRSTEKRKEEGSILDAVVNLRGWNGRRRISGAGRSSGAATTRSRNIAR